MQERQRCVQLPPLNKLLLNSFTITGYSAWSPVWNCLSLSFGSSLIACYQNGIRMSFARLLWITFNIAKLCGKFKKVSEKRYLDQFKSLWFSYADPEAELEVRIPLERYKAVGSPYWYGPPLNSQNTQLAISVEPPSTRLRNVSDVSLAGRWWPALLTVYRLS